MRIAVPLAAGRLSAHFGHCEEFAILDVDAEARNILEHRSIPAPPHVPGMLPGWLQEQGVHKVIAGGMGGRALQLFAAQSIEVFTGAPEMDAATLVRQYLEGQLASTGNTCGHDGHGHDCGH